MAFSFALRALVVTCALLIGAASHAQTYPSKPVRLLVGFPPGGSNDIVARLLAQKLGETMGQPFVVENRGGANTAIATDLGAHAAPDGYTILLNAPGHVTNPAMMKLNFDSVRDFAFISLLAETPNLLVVHPSVPARSVKELIAFSKKNQGRLNYASGGVGTSVHLSAELFQNMTGVKWIHVPYKGTGPALVELLAGQTSIMFPNLPGAIGYARTGKLRALAVTGAKRSPAAPKTPTVAESGVPGFEVTAWFGLSAPAKTPRPVLDRLGAEVVKAVKSPDLRERLIGAGADPIGSSAEEYTAFIQREIAKWSKVIAAAGIKAQ